MHKTGWLKFREPRNFNRYLAPAPFKTALPKDTIKSEEDLKAEANIREKRVYDWLVECGAEFRDCSIRDLPSGIRGMATTADIPKGVRFMSIPLKCVIMEDLAKFSPLAVKIKEKGLLSRLHYPHLTQVVSYVLEEMLLGEESFHAPYFGLLPRDYSFAPIRWNDEDLANLEGSDAVRILKSRRTSTREDYDLIVEEVLIGRTIHHW